MKYGSQTTLKDHVSLEGIGVHSGKPVSITLHPAEPDTGIIFQRTHLEGGREREIPALHGSVIDTRLCTVIGDPARGSVGTIEHLMAALRGMGIDNVLVEIDGPEMPIMDGSSRAFVAAIDQVGVETLRVRRRLIRVLKPVRVDLGRAWAELLPAERGFQLDVEIDFDTPLIGRQRKVLDLTPETFRKELSGARTFGFVKDVEQLWKLGLALGSSLDNSVALGEDRVLNPEGLRYPDEFARHKMLDAVGDLALAGAPLIGRFRSYCGGHRLNFMVLEALFAADANWTILDQPVRRETGHAELSAGLAVAAFAPDTN
ncbi:UDP-3-O-acyl-N-acetylglucosamine deacetylase [Labrys wisconsinensis]|uniref:UDP-3-O-acyl-N-acetylglucosamine deacetylase n=1 Tax=Labrys wisconsinensis TaxID=425677 RepID=A0ABU0JBH0_9HYPH|nr:UDP-3-O-acyl-N-acetylglucosamine deacetylase [Labrys wisconsinensis]MDQ0471626.1 UDP-3-O-[3-hydroxymyristoyl] N-acetylglucosamine deacetylase [Labrys wisconsinensis]